MRTIEDVCSFLKAVETYYLATIDGDKPQVRPFGTAHLFEGRLYIETGLRKEVAKQIAKNPHIAICAFDGKSWLRISATAVAKAGCRGSLYMAALYHGRPAR